MAIPFLVNYLIGAISLWVCSFMCFDEDQEIKEAECNSEDHNQSKHAGRKKYRGIIQFSVLALLFMLAQIASLLDEKAGVLSLIIYSAVWAVPVIRILITIVKKKAANKNQKMEDLWEQQWNCQILTLAYLGLMLFLYIAVMIKVGIL